MSFIAMALRSEADVGTISGGRQLRAYSVEKLRLNRWPVGDSISVLASGIERDDGSKARGATCAVLRILD